MVATLASLLPRLRMLLNNTGSIYWEDEQLTEYIQAAKDMLQGVSPMNLKISGLDEATITSLDAGMVTFILRAAQVLAWEYYLRIRTEMYQPDPQQPGEDRQFWLDGERKFIAGELERYRLMYLQKTETPPYSAWPAPAAPEDGPEDV